MSLDLDFEAIYKAYAGIVVTIDDDTGAYDASGNLISLDQSKIDTARAEIDTELATTKYQRDRAAEYPSWQSQLDFIYHNGIEKWKTVIVDPVKKKYPKPSS